MKSNDIYLAICIILLMVAFFVCMLVFGSQRIRDNELICTFDSDIDDMTITREDGKYIVHVNETTYKIADEYAKIVVDEDAKAIVYVYGTHQEIVFQINPRLDGEK